MDFSILDDLTGIAEIATVFVGFAVLVSFLNTKSSHRIHISGIVIGASMVLVACLLPLFFRTMPMELSTIVRLSSVAFIALNALATVAMFRSIPGFAESQRSQPAVIVWGIEGAMYLCLLLCALGIWTERAVSLYFGAILLLLFQVIGLFLSLTINLSREGGD